MAVTKQLLLIAALCFPTCCISTSTDLNDLPSFASFISKHGRKYSVGTKEYDDRQSVYEQSLEQVRQQNSNPGRLWDAGVNHLSDWTAAELSQLRGLRLVQSSKKSGRAAGTIGLHSNRGQFLAQVKSTSFPEEKSWGHLSAVQQDIDQGSCGSCWAVATSMMLQSNAEIAGLNRTFSAQELVDCVPNPHKCGGSGGCDGATVELAMNYVMDAGLEESTFNPYFGIDLTCRKKKGTMLLSDGNDNHHDLESMIAVGFHAAKSESPALALQIQGWERLPENEYEPLIRAVAEHGPVGVSVTADAWNNYHTGLFDGCSPDATIDHAVTLIGYGTDKERNQKYWTIKNSWGNSWGENGNIRLLRKEGNVHCGTDYKPKLGTGCDDAPSSVHVCGMCGILYDSVVPHFQKK